MAKLTIPTAPVYTPPVQLDPNDPAAKTLFKLEQNLRRFDEDRRKFELEKLRFVQQKRELDRMRLARFDKYKTDVLTREPHLSPSISPTSSLLTAPEFYRREPGAPRVDSPMPRKSYKLKQKRLQIPDYESSTVDTSELDSDIETTKKSFRKSVEREIEERKALERRSLSRQRASTPNPEIEITAPLVVEAKLEEEKLETSDKKDDEVKVIKKDDEIDEFEDAQEELPEKGWKAFRKLLMLFLKESWVVWRQFKVAKAKDYKVIRSHIRRCFLKLLVWMIFIGLGGLLFKYIEGNYESLYKCGTKRISRNFIDQLWLSSHNLRLEHAFFEVCVLNDFILGRRIGSLTQEIVWKSLRKS